MTIKNILVILAMTLLVACGADEQHAELDYKKLSIEHQFAIVNAGHEVDASDKTTIRAKELLQRASEQYDEPQENIADMAVKASKIIKAEGIDVSPMEMLEATTLAYIKDSKFAENAALYVGLRKSGQPHTEAIIALKGILKCSNSAC